MMSAAREEMKVLYEILTVGYIYFFIYFLALLLR